MLFEKYGHVIIPRGTILFRRFPHNEIADNMFFAFKESIAKLGQADNDVQEWKCLQDIKVLFMASHFDSHGNVYGSINEIFNYLFPEIDTTNYSCLKIKKDVIQRKSLIEKLNHAGIQGWFTSANDNSDLEVYIWGSEEEILHRVKFQKFIKEDEKSYRNALINVKLVPSANFYINSRRTSFKEYQSVHKGIIKIDESYGLTKKQAKEDNYNIRMKLKA